MQVILSDECLEYALELLLSETVVYHLYANNFTPDKSSTLGSFTEATVGGYAPIQIDPPDWIAPSTSGHVASNMAALITFVASAGLTQDCYGYYVTDLGGTNLRWFAIFDTQPTELNDVGLSVIPIQGDVSRYG